MARQQRTPDEATTSRRSPLFVAAIAAATIVPVAAILLVATYVAGSRPAEQAISPGPTVTRTVTPSAPPSTSDPAPIVTGIPITSPDDPLLEELTTNPATTQACKFFLGNINSDEWSATIERFISLFATAATLTADEDLIEVLDKQVDHATETGIPDNQLTADAVELCTSTAD